MDLKIYFKREEALFDLFKKEILFKVPNGIITGGIAANHYNYPKYRRFSDDIDYLVRDLSGLPGKKSYIKELGVSFKVLEDKENKVRIYLIKFDEDVPYRREILRTFIDIVNKNPGLEVNIVEPEFLSKKKIEFMLWDRRGREVIKDVYDLLSSNILFSFFKTYYKGESREGNAYLYIVWKTDLLKNAIVYIEWPEHIRDRARVIVEDKFFDIISALKFILYCESGSFLKKVGRLLGIKTTRAIDIVNKLNVNEEEVKKIVLLYTKDLEKGRRELLNILSKG